jgi:hypothetical protein
LTSGGVEDVSQAPFCGDARTHVDDEAEVDHVRSGMEHVQQRAG